MKTLEKECEPSISVCLAAFNGSDFVIEQIFSILGQLKQDDELIIVDDCSLDDTVSLIEKIPDPRIKILKNDSNQREIKSFCTAIRAATREIIFLSDQDDIWTPGRVGLMTQALRNSGAQVVSSNFTWIDSSGKPVDIRVDGVQESKSTRHLANIIDIFVGKTNYYGCAMAFRRDFSRIVTPIPAFVESHDLWIALASNISRSNVHTESRTLLKRQHGNNATSPVSARKLHSKIWSRVLFVLSIFVIFKRLQQHKSKFWELVGIGR
jgi:glycosyltransferase involved in cell wall biosynthesis